MIEKVHLYAVCHDVSKEQGAAHLHTRVYADGTLIPNLTLASITVNSSDFTTKFESKEGVYPRSDGLEVHLSFLSGFNVIGIYPDIIVCFDGKKVNYVQSFTYTIDMTKDTRLPLVHLAIL